MKSWNQPWRTVQSYFESNLDFKATHEFQPWNQPWFQKHSFCAFLDQPWFQGNLNFSQVNNIRKLTREFWRVCKYYHLNDSLVSSLGRWLLVRRFSNINVVSSHKEVVVCRSAAGPFRACLDLFFCQNGVFKNEKGITPNSSGLLGWRPSSKGLGVLKNSFLIVFFKSTNS